MTWPVTAPEYGSYRFFGREVGLYLNYSPNYESWDEDQEAYVDRIVEQGVQQYYYPPAVDGYNHEWDFMRPITELTTAAEQDEYDLPEDFERVDGDITYVDSNDFFHPIQITSDAYIRSLEHIAYNSYPTKAAIIPIGSLGNAHQVQRLLLHPTPDSNYLLKFRYHALPRKLSDDFPFPLGGKAHAEGIAASCLAAAEVKRTGAQGPLYATFLIRLATAVAQDLKRGPRNLGYNADPASMRGSGASRSGYRDYVFYRGVTFEGADYSGG